MNSNYYPDQVAEYLRERAEEHEKEKARKAVVKEEVREAVEVRDYGLLGKAALATKETWWEARMKTARGTIQDLQEKLAACRSPLGSLEDALAAQRDENNRQRKVLMARALKISELETIYKARVDETVWRKKEFEKMQGKRNQAQAVIVKLRGEVASQYKALRTRNEKIDSLRHACSHLPTPSQVVVIKDLRDSVGNLDRIAGEQRERAQCAEHAHQAVLDTNERLRKTNTDGNIKVESLRAEINRQAEVIYRKSTAIDRQGKEVRKLYDTLSSVRVAAKQLRGSNDCQRETIARLQGEVGQVRASVRPMRDQLAHTDQCRANLANDLELMSVENAKLRKKVEEAENAGPCGAMRTLRRFVVR